MSDPLGDFLWCVRRAGLQPPREAVADGEIHRFASAGRASDDAGWYVLHRAFVGQQDRFYGAFGCWRSGVKATWSSHDALSFGERAQLLAAVARDRQQQRERKRERDAAGRDRAAALWHGAGPCDPLHPYLVDKGLPGDHRLRQYGDDLLVPMYDWQCDLWNVQKITPGGGKRYGSGRAAGLVLPLGDLTLTPRRILVGEGYATCRAAELAELADTVVVAFCAGALDGAVKEARARWPVSSVAVLADNDCDTPGNPGLAAARACGVPVLVPDDGSGRSVDFADLWRAYGGSLAGQYLTREGAP